MKPDSTWLDLRNSDGDVLLQEYLRSYNVLNDFPLPEKQSPRLIMMIGTSIKAAVMRKLRFGICARNPRGEIHLQTNIETLSMQSPYIFADCGLHWQLKPPRLPAMGVDHGRGDIIRRPLLWQRAKESLEPEHLAYRIYAKVLAPFSTVICFFAEDLGGLARLSEMILLWVLSSHHPASDLQSSTFPRVLILKPREEDEEPDEEVQTRRFMSLLLEQAASKMTAVEGQNGKPLTRTMLRSFVNQQFHSIKVLTLPTRRSTSSWEDLKARILQVSEEAQADRKHAQFVFSFQHFKVLFGMACDHFSSNSSQINSFVRASRIQRPVPSRFQYHLEKFLKQVQPSQIHDFAVPMIASALAFDNYPPGMHAFFPPNVFNTFYNELCLRLDPCWSPYAKAEFSVLFTTAIQENFCRYASATIHASNDDVSGHQDTMKSFREHFKRMFSYQTCFSCLARSPENTLTCHHALCNECIMSHGYELEKEQWTFHIDLCPLCTCANSIVFKQKPATAGVRALIAEGGGVRGIVPLSFLKEVQNRLDLPANIQEHFDIALGSSSGALIILGLFNNLWSVDQCTEQFEHLSRLAFRQRRLYDLPLVKDTFVRRLMEIILSLATDSRYSSKGIDKALKVAFGEDTAFFGIPGGGTKVAITATTTDKSSTCIFANYNGDMPRQGYRIIRPQNLDDEIRVRPAVRASSAAPPYFKSFQGFQDGGLGGHNNPINLALWEQKIIWPRKDKQPDVVLSLGTGFKRNDVENDEELSFWRARFVPRLFRSFMNSFVGETRWQELRNTLLTQYQDRYHRLNIEFHAHEPELDDLRSMASLRQQSTCVALSNVEVKRAADNILAALFYIELDNVPQLERSGFVCRGKIRCRLQPSSSALKVLICKLKETSASFYVRQHIIPIVNSQIQTAVNSGQAFARPIYFQLASLNEEVDIKVDGIVDRPRSISNCPYKFQTLIEDQGLHHALGTRTHKRSGKPDESRVNKRLRLV